MPQLWVRGIPLQKLKACHKPLFSELAEICECETDNFSIEFWEGITLQFDDHAPSFPFVEVKWFDRGREVRDRFAQSVSRYLFDVGVHNVEIAFICYEKDAYYADGVSFAEDLEQ